MNTFHLRITGDLGFEVWQDIPGYEGLYQASTYGRIKNLTPRYKNKIFLKPVKHHNGYVFVNLIGKIFSVHRIV